MLSADARLARIAQRQHGVVSLSEALACGLTWKQVARRVNSGMWVRVHRAVYRTAGSPQTFESRTMAAVLAAGPDAIASHGTAAFLWKLDDCKAPETIDVAVPRRRRVQLPGVAVHAPVGLLNMDRTHIGVIPITTPARTIIDTARTASADSLDVALDDAIRRGYVDPKKLLRRIRGMKRQGRGGIALLIAMLEERVGHSPRGSAAETRFARALRDAKLPSPISQYEIRTPTGRFVARVDFAYPDVGLAIEIDGDAYHSSRRQREHDTRRQNALIALGWTPLRFAARTVTRSPAEAVAVVASALARAGFGATYRP